MLRQLTRLASRASACQQQALVYDPLHQAPPWQDVAQSVRNLSSWQRAACSPACSMEAAAAAAKHWQQQSWRTYKSGYEQSRERNKKGIIDGAMYLVSWASTDACIHTPVLQHCVAALSIVPTVRCL